MSLGKNPNFPAFSMAQSNSRREFLKFCTMAGTGAAAWSIASPLAAVLKPEAVPRPDSKVFGVQLGINVPYSFGNLTMSAADILKHCIQLGFSAVELRTQPVEAFWGGPGADDKSAAGAAKLTEWRKSVPVDRGAEFRKWYETAGVLIEILKVDGLFKMTDTELDYVFGLAKALGARAISSEISHQEGELERVGRFADQHQFMVAYHGHATTKPEDWERAFALAKFNGANVDLGHFVAGNNTSPVPFLKKHHERISHVHLKDRKRQNGPNTPFGEGDTPIAEVLRLIRDERWNMQATIEFEYKIPTNSDRMTEIARALKFCRDALA